MAAVDTFRPAAPTVTIAAPGGAAPTTATVATSTTGPMGAPVAGGKSGSLTLYVGDLSPEVTETDLFATFNAVGAVTNIRVCRHFATRESLGYAYVNFQSAEEAGKAMSALNYTNIKGRPCRIMWSQRDPSTRRNNVGNVFVKNLGPEITVKELNETFRLFGNILSCKVAQDPRGASKGYGFVHFEDEESARLAIRDVHGLEWNGRTVECKPYVAKNQRSGPEWNNLYVKNVPREWTEKTLTDTFAVFGDISSVVLTTDATGASRGFGFVCFKSHTSAMEAEKALNGKEVEGTPAAPTPFKKAGKESGVGAGAEAATTPAADGPTKLKLYVGRALKKAERERQLREKKEASRAERVASWSKRNLWVCNLDESVDDAVLKREFSKFGTVESATVARDGSGRSRLFGYVLLGSPEEATKAITGMNKKMLGGKPLNVKLWEPKEAREARQAQRSERRTGAGAGVGAAGAVPTAAGLAPFGAAALGANPVMAGLMQNLQRLTALINSGTATPADVSALQQLQMQMLYFVFMQQMATAGSSRFGGPGAAVGRAPMPGAMPGMRPGVPGGGSMFNPLAAGGAMAGTAPGNMFAMNPAVAAMFAQAMTSGAAGVPLAAGGPSAGSPPANGRGGASRQGGAPRGATGSQARGGAPATGRPAPVPAGVSAAGRPTAAAIVARGTAATTAPATGGGAPAGGASMQYHPGARNVEEAGAGGLGGGAAAGTAPVEVSFTQMLAKASPEVRKNMIGERLYKQVAVMEGNKAGKITGMLLEGMDESELLHLLEAPADLRARIGEALDVLRAHPATA